MLSCSARHPIVSRAAQPTSVLTPAAPLRLASTLKFTHTHSQRCSTCVPSSWLNPAPPRPRYYDYLSSDQIKEISAEHYWQIVNVDLDAEATFWSCMRWIPGFLKFHVIPLPLKFIFLVVWRPIRRLLFKLHKQFVLLLCRLDAALSRKPKDLFSTTSGTQARFSRDLALKRLHCNRSILQDMAYWMKLVTQKGS